MSFWGGQTLRRFVHAIFVRLGMEEPFAAAMGDILVETDLLGHTTHGVALVPLYLDEIAQGKLACKGAPTLLADRKASVSWDGNMLPGLWLLSKAVALACDRAQEFGTAAVAIGNSHHMGCLASYLQRVTNRGLAITIFTSAPSSSSVAPFGGRSGVLSPAPTAAGFPTKGDPILIDISASITTNNMAARLVREGGRFPYPAVISSDGTESEDPAILSSGGALLSAGGMTHGQKGFGWALMAEGLSQGLAGYGRSTMPQGVVNSVLVQVYDPAAFAGTETLLREMTAIADACRSATPLDANRPVRLPGQAGLDRKRRALSQGLSLYPGVMEALIERAQAFGLTPPEPIS